MLFKLSLSSIKNSFRDYAVYFYTLIIGVSVFYSFNAVSGQAAMLELIGESGRIAKMLTPILSIISIFVAVVLGLLIVYANRFLMKRRSREFAVYLLLGMGKRGISALLLLETMLTGAISLITGLIIGAVISQLMGIFVVHLFSVDMSFYHFHFSGEAVVKTILYFTVMYLVVMLMSGHAVSKMKLIDLLNAGKKTENVKLKNPVLCVIMFIAADIILAGAYYKVIMSTSLTLSTGSLSLSVIAGIIATFMLFWSVSGMMLRIFSSMKKTYYRGLNSFTFRQISSKVNTVVFSMSIICLMLFFTICLLTLKIIGISIPILIRLQIWGNYQISPFPICGLPATE